MAKQKSVPKKTAWSSLRKERLNGAWFALTNTKTRLREKGLPSAIEKYCLDALDEQIHEVEEELAERRERGEKD